MLQHISPVINNMEVSSVFWLGYYFASVSCFYWAKNNFPHNKWIRLHWGRGSSLITAESVSKAIQCNKMNLFTFRRPNTATHATIMNMLVMMVGSKIEKGTKTGKQRAAFITQTVGPKRGYKYLQPPSLCTMHTIPLSQKWLADTRKHPEIHTVYCVVVPGTSTHTHKRANFPFSSLCYSVIPTRLQKLVTVIDINSST